MRRAFEDFNGAKESKHAEAGFVLLMFSLNGLVRMWGLGRRFWGLGFSLLFCSFVVIIKAQGAQLGLSLFLGFQFSGLGRYLARGLSGAFGFRVWGLGFRV